MQKKTYLNFVPFSSFDKWYVSYYINPYSIKSNYKLEFLSNIITPLKEKIKKLDYKGDLPVIAKISFADGKIHLRDEKQTGMDLYKLNLNDLLVSKINFHQGAVAINKIGDLVCSTHYQPYKINYSIINPDYLILVIRSSGFKDFLSFLRADGIKNEATYEFIGSLQIPLPSLEEQSRIVAAFNEKLKRAEQLEYKATELEDSIEKYLFDELGIIETNKVNAKTKKILKFIKFSETQRWDALFFLGNLPTFVSGYERVKFSDIIKYFNKGENGKTIRIDSPKFPNDDFRYIGMEHIEKVTGILLDMPEVKGKEIKSQTLRIPKNFFIYGKLRPYLNKYWINDTDFDNIICSSEFFVFDTIDTLDKLFFKYVLSSKIIQNQISDKTSGARMPRINEDIFFNLQFPLPPIETQIKISDNITLLKSEINNLKILSKENREKAIIEFEKAIFN